METLVPAPTATQNSPYLDARKEWDERYGSLISRANNWRRAAFVALLIALLETGGLIALALLISARWLTVTGFSALWGAFTFPLAALCSALFALHMDITATVLLIFALGLIPFVLIKVMQAWAKGSLAAKTNAAEA